MFHSRARGRPHAAECCVPLVLGLLRVPSLLQPLLFSTWLRARGQRALLDSDMWALIDRSACLEEPSRSRSCFQQVWHRFLSCRSRRNTMSLVFVCTLLLSRCFALHLAFRLACGLGLFEVYTSFRLTSQCRTILCAPNLPPRPASSSHVGASSSTPLLSFFKG